MRQYTALLLIALVGMTIQIEMMSVNNSPAKRILGKIDSLVQSCRNEQAAQTRIYISQAKRCVVEKAFRKKEIQDSSVAKGAADQQLQICKGEIPVAKSSKRQTKNEIAATINQLTEARIEYGLYQTANIERQKEHKEAIDNIQTAYNIIGQFQNGKTALKKNVFIEVSQHLNKIVRVSIKHKFHTELIPVMSALVQITAKPQAALSYSTLGKVVSLLRNLENKIKQSENNRAIEWKKYQALFKKQTGLLQAQVKSLKLINKRYSSYISNLNTCKAKEGKILRMAISKFNRNKKILDASITMCNAYDIKYNVQTKERNAYLSLLGQLRNFVVTAIKNYKNGLYVKGDFVHQ